MTAPHTCHPRRPRDSPLGLPAGVSYKDYIKHVRTAGECGLCSKLKHSLGMVDSVEDAAAVRLQSMFRGRQARQMTLTNFKLR